ncbi:amidase [Streptococcus rupicaprae]
MMYQDATAMAMAVRHKEVSAKELVEEAIAKIEALNPAINAVVNKQYEEAIKRSQQAFSKEQPFAGVPILLKDLGQNQAGQPSTSGSRLFASYRAQQTDYLVQRFEALGFIILGRTNTPEFGFKNISDSSLHGPVHLPMDLSRNAGGSSGGAAAAVSSGIVPLAGASDGGGSIRIPASFNGLIGLKTSRGRIPVGPGSYRGWQGASVHFALTKSVRDTRRLLYYTQTCQMESPFVLPTLSQETLFERKWQRPLKIAYSALSPIGQTVSREAVAAVEGAVSFLSQMGHDLIELTDYPIDHIDLIKDYYVMNSVETAAMFDTIEQSLERPMTPDDMELMTWAIYKSGQTIPAKQYSQTLNHWDQYTAQFAAFHENYDLLLTPTTAGVAPKHGQFTLSDNLQESLLAMGEFPMEQQQDLIWEMFADSLAWTPFTIPANLTGQPAISLPTYRNEAGLPIGIQFLAAKGREELLLQVADLFEGAGMI